MSWSSALKLNWEERGKIRKSRKKLKNTFWESERKWTHGQDWRRQHKYRFLLLEFGANLNSPKPNCSSRKPDYITTGKSHHVPWWFFFILGAKFMESACPADCFSSEKQCNVHARPLKILNTLIFHLDWRKRFKNSTVLVLQPTLRLNSLRFSFHPATSTIRSRMFTDKLPIVKVHIIKVLRVLYVCTITQIINA